MLLYGQPGYYRIGRQAILSILKNTDFDIFLTLETEKYHHLKISRSPRLQLLPLKEKPADNSRAAPFLLKFEALRNCLKHSRSDQILLLDSDTIVATKINPADITNALDGHGFGMVEQTTIIGSTMNRRDFLKHYQNHSLVWLAPDQTPPTLENFRFYNSGVVLGQRHEFSRLVEWALATIAQSPTTHQVGEHMIADQDYFQFWTNTLHPGSCKTLSWHWNHCRYWDDGFPRCEAKILHFSNFCRGPGNLHQLQTLFFRQWLQIKRLFCQT